jgi:hypothetical protein
MMKPKIFPLVAPLERIEKDIRYAKVINSVSDDSYENCRSASSRSRDLEDIRAILVKNPGYDADYIDGWQS